MNETDFLIEPYPLVRAGGQHVTTTRSAIQVTHIPTQLTVICSHERSQVRNKNFAVEMINNALEKLKHDSH
jgi:protein subunit release factor A